MANVVRRTLRCTRAERAEIRERAAALGMSVSGYLVACALHEDAGGPRRDEPRLVLSEEQQLTLYQRVTSTGSIALSRASARTSRRSARTSGRFSVARMFHPSRRNRPTRESQPVSSSRPSCCFRNASRGMPHSTAMHRSPRSLRRRRSLASPRSPTSASMRASVTGRSRRRTTSRLELRRRSKPHPLRPRAGEHGTAQALRHRPHRGARARRRRDYAQSGQEPEAGARLPENDRQRRPAASARLTVSSGSRPSSRRQPSARAGASGHARMKPYSTLAPWRIAIARHDGNQITPRSDARTLKKPGRP